MSEVHQLSPSCIQEADVSIARLCSLLSAAVIDHKIDEDGFIIAAEAQSCPVCVEILRDRKLLRLFSYYPVPDDWTLNSSVEELLDVINTINKLHYLSHFYWDGDNVFGTHLMTFDTRLDPRHFIQSLRRFSSEFVEGVQHLRDSIDS